MAELHVLETPKEQATSDAREVLTNAVDAEFESVLVCGFKNGEVKIMFSRINDTCKVLGAIEALKFQLLQDWR